MYKRHYLKKWTTVLICAVMLLSLLPGTASADSSVWNGTADTSWYNGVDTEFTITTAEQLAGLAALVSGGNDFTDKTVTLGGNIVLNTWTDSDGDEVVDSGELSNQSGTGTAPIDWTPIGRSAPYFNGTFDGDGYTVSGVYIDSTDHYQGLFGVINTDALVKNAGVTDSYIEGKDNFGGFAGHTYGTISNCYFTGSLVSAGGHVGGIAGYNTGTIINCHSSGSVSTSSSADVNEGGIIGKNNGAVSYCYNTGSVTGRGNYVGGVTGLNYSGSTVTNCYNTGNISGANRVGGVAGFNGGNTVTNCCNTGRVAAAAAMSAAWWDITPTARSQIAITRAAFPASPMSAAWWALYQQAARSRIAPR
jgi:hypothetical protein